MGKYYVQTEGKLADVRRYISNRIMAKDRYVSKVASELYNVNSVQVAIDAYECGGFHGSNKITMSFTYVSFRNRVNVLAITSEEFNMLSL